MLFAPATGRLVHRHCALCTKHLECLCDQDPLCFPTNYPPVLISKEEKWQNPNIQLQKCKQSFYPLFFQASHQVQDCIANWFSLHPQPSRSIPWGQSLQEEGWERLSHCWTHQHPVLCHIKWIKFVPRESLLKMPEVQLIC